MTFTEAVAALDAALRRARARTQIYECVESIGISRAVLPTLFAVQNDAHWAGRNLVAEFLREIRRRYDFAESLIPVEAEFEGEFKGEVRFYYKNPAQRVGFKDPPFLLAIRQLLMPNSGCTVSDVLRDLELNADQLVPLIIQVGVAQNEQDAVQVRFEQEQRVLAEIEQEMIPTLPKPKAKSAQFLNQWVHATFGTEDNLFAGYDATSGLQPVALYLTSIVCAIKSAMIDPSYFVAFSLVAILTFGFVVATLTKPPKIGEVRHRDTQVGQPVDVLYWIGPRLIARYRPNKIERFVCALLGFATVVLILVFATSVFR